MADLRPGVLIHEITAGVVEPLRKGLIANLYCDNSARLKTAASVSHGLSCFALFGRTTERMRRLRLLNEQIYLDQKLALKKGHL